jgi:hypothetical protein
MPHREGTGRFARHYLGEWNVVGRPPMSSSKEFECFARDCVRLAEQADTPLLREKLLQMAREWMRAVMDEEDTNVEAGS